MAYPNPGYEFVKHMLPPEIQKKFEDPKSYIDPNKDVISSIFHQPPKKPLPAIPTGPIIPRVGIPIQVPNNPTNTGNNGQMNIPLAQSGGTSWSNLSQQQIMIIAGGTAVLLFVLLY